LSRIKSDKILGGEYSKKRGLNVYAYGFNVKHSPVDHPLARKAIAASIQRKLIINLAVGGGQSPARTFIPPDILGTKGFREDQGIEFNPDQAKKWLAEAGYPGGKGFPELTLLHDDSQSDLKIADALRESLKHHLGINVKLIARDFNAPLKEWLIKDSPHMFQLEWHAKYPDPSAALYDIFHPLYSDNHTGWSHSDFLDLLRKADAVSDPN
jgi:oligopeptide transport system substrate-binding protein